VTSNMLSLIWLLALLMMCAVLSACGASVEANMTLLKTPCVSIQTAGAGVNYSGGVTANASAGGVTATADPNCPEILLTSLSYTLYQDRNNNDQKDP
jgi:hypothetical protein